MKILNRIALIAILSIIAINVLCPVLTFAKDVEKNTEDNNYYSNEIIDSKLCKSDADKQNIENRNFSESYKEYLKLSDEEKEKVEVIPRKYDISIKDFYEKDEDEKKQVQNFKRTQKKSRSNVYNNAEIPTKFDLRDQIDIQVENQEKYGLCWDFASTKSLETYLAVHGYSNYDFSELHPDYLESIEFGTKRELHSGGSFNTYVDYISKYGPVMEKDVPYNAEYKYEDYFYLAGLKQETYVGDVVQFPTIDKKYDENYNVTYFNNGEEISEDDVQDIRNKIKEHIMENGGLYASIVGPSWSSVTPAGSSISYEIWDKKSNFMCMRGPFFDSHAVTIIGWDDDFSADNYTRTQKPKNDGAYIALNSWGKGWGDSGIFYISYDDKYVEKELCGFTEASVNDKSVIYKEIKLEDKNLYIALKDIIGKQIESYDDNTLTINANKLFVSTISKLDLSNRGIKNISGLEHFKGLHVLNLTNNEIEDISSLSQIDDLWEIYLNNNRIKNIDVLSLFPNIFYIEADSNNIENINFSLDSFDWLDEISLADNDIKDMSKFYNINNDSEYAIMIDLSGNKNLNLSTIDLSKTYKLELRNCKFDNIQLEVTDEAILNELDLSNNNIMDLSCIPIIDSLELNLANNNIENVSNLPNIKFNILNLSDNKNLDLSSLNNVNVFELFLGNCNIDDEKIKSLPKDFKRLHLENNPISDLSFLEGRKLYLLDISYTNINSLNNLYKYEPNIYDLYASGIKDITGINNFSRLKRLKLDNCGIKDLSFLSKYTDLSFLSLNNNEIEDITPLKYLKNPNAIYLANNNISNIEVFNDVDTKSLYVDLSNNKIADFTTIKKDIDFILVLCNQKVEEKFDIPEPKEYSMEFPDFIKSIYYRLFKDDINVQLNNCEIDYMNKSFTIYPTRKGEGTASVGISGGMFDGSEYLINYNIINNYNLVGIEYEYTGKLEFEEGEDFDINSLKVYAVYEDGYKEEITDYDLDNYKSLNSEQDKIVIKYENHENYIGIKVNSFKNIKFNDENVYNVMKKICENNNIEIVSNDLEFILQINKNDIEKIKNIRIDGVTKDLTGLSEFESVEKLSIDNYENESLFEVIKLQNLEVLELNNSHVSNITQLNVHPKLKNIILINSNIETVKNLNNNYVLKIENSYSEGQLKIEDKKIYLPNYINEIYYQRTNPVFSTVFNSRINKLEDGSFYVEINNDSINFNNENEISDSITLKDDEGDEITVNYSFKLESIFNDIDILEFEDDKLFNLMVDTLNENGLNTYLLNKSVSQRKLIIDNGFIENIQFLILDLDGVSNIKGLSGLTGLRKLFINNINVSDFSEFEKMYNLEELLIYKSNLESISQMGIIPNLKSLYLRNTNIKSIEKEYNSMSLNQFHINNYYDISQLNSDESKIYLPDYFNELIKLIDEPIYNVQYTYNLQSNFIEVIEDGELKVDENGKYYVEMLNDISRNHVPSYRQIEVVLKNENDSIGSHLYIEYLTEKTEEDDIILGYDTNEKGYIINVKPKTPIDDFKNIFTCYDDIQIIINDGEQLEQEYAYTGMRVTLLNKDGERILDKNNNPTIYSLAVNGDINGDGLADGIDSLLLKAIRAEIPIDNVCEECFEAADINKDGKINYLDSRYLLLHRAEVENYNLNFILK